MANRAERDGQDRINETSKSVRHTSQRTYSKFFGVRFTAPVKPGDALETQVWEVGPGPAGTTEVTFVTKNLTTGKIALGGGIAYIKKSPSSKL
ncbi:hypothetical protein D9615_003402 [Tricholomella constricta]|uniref:MaoC-like domain-containing protein n=1 Tax=Tricholomella constricta TaxID=117010 RepID=A0A8H5HJH2_9AGAR|nr:hypothetical protein D9615_003402 [Tricholomella constricta]